MNIESENPGTYNRYKMSSVKIVDATWQGPYSWPGYEDQNGLPALPDLPGVYIQAFEYHNGYLIFGVGITRRTGPLRFREHTAKYLAGEYNVLELRSLHKGVRKEIWHGWDYAKAHRDEFEERKEEILKAVHIELAGACIFIASNLDMDKDKRFLERLEASIMNVLYKQPPPLRDVPDEGMFLSPRWESEEPLIIRNRCDARLYGLPDLIEI